MATCDVQPFDGSLHQAHGVLSVEEATLGECPYSPEQIACLLGQPTQHAVVALQRGRVVGFVAGFETTTLAGHILEVDLLAVHPSAQGQGIGRRLLSEAGALARALGASRARGLVAISNSPSQKSFLGAGYVPSGNSDLMVCDHLEARGPATDWDLIGLCPLSRLEELRQLGLDGQWASPASDEIMSSLHPARHEVWLGKENDALLGFCETLWVDTLLYKGIWIESLRAQGHDHRAFTGLVSHVIGQARASGLDKVGILVDGHLSGRIRLLQQLGFHRMGAYRWHESHCQPRSEG